MYGLCCSLSKSSYLGLRIRNNLIQHPRHNTKYHNRGHHHGHGKGLGAIGDQISQACFCAQEFAYNQIGRAHV